MADERADDLSDAISLLWRHGRGTAAGRSTAQAASQETPHPLADDLQQLWYERIACMGRRSPGASSADQGPQER